MNDWFRPADQSSAQREAAFFYALFLRGHGLESLRRDIDVPPELFAKWMRASDFEPPFRETLQKMYDYRKQVLAIFDALIQHEAIHTRPQ